ncbi:UNVERIFIED_CONTAM: Retrovirus-related Pol polyprotein from transposon RE2 [Sesamum latifolium]|uniref:Retrovirus-related Pol polyprotein from transposon RE2 n=1 Tax=Sesamum latifolium TaxID=2727402 RepID=A0AAW2XE03_9LAMI
MLSLVEKFEDLKTGLDNDTCINMIFQLLPPSYDSFVVNYNMNGLEKSVHELINMMIQYEATTHKSGPSVLIGEASTTEANGKRAGRWKSKKGKGKAVAATVHAPSAPIAPVEMGKGKEKVQGYQWSKERDIGRRSAHNSFQSRRLTKNEMILKIGNGKAVAAEAIGSVKLAISHLVRVVLNDCFYVPSIVKNIISIPVMDKEGVLVLLKSARVTQPLERCGFVGLTSQLNNDPKTYGEAISDIDSDKWLKAMKSKIDSMGSNQVWTLVDLSKGVKPVGYKWVYKCKLGANGEVITFKARLVAKGYTQRPGVDFEETYSHVAMAKSIRILLVIAAWYDYEYGRWT